MAATKDNPTYTVYLIENSSTKYNITPAVISISMSNQDNQVAQRVEITAANIKIATGKTSKALCSLFEVRKRVFIYANDGEKKEEVFRGFTWTKYHETDLETNEGRITCYDNLIYLQESEDSLYFSKGKKTKSVISNICKKWGIKLNYTYSSITHSKLVLRGTLTDIMMSEILDKVKRRTGNKYVIYSQKDVMNVAPVGSNSKIYEITSKHNAIVARHETTMDGMVTKVKILGQANKNTKNLPVVATVKGDTKKYGTLQKLQDAEYKDKNIKLAAAKKEARYTIKKDGKPKKEIIIEAVDIPWIKKGDAVKVKAGHVSGNKLIVAGIERDISNKKKTMTLTIK